MADIMCGVCGEPWDAYGVRHGDMEPSEARQFLRGSGCPSCDFGRSCVHCHGSGKEPLDGILRLIAGGGCRWCHDQRYLILRRLLGAREWFVSGGRYLPAEAREGLRIIYRYPVSECRDGAVEEVKAVCLFCEAEACERCEGTGQIRRSPEEAEALRFGFLVSCEEASE